MSIRTSPALGLRLSALLAVILLLLVALPVRGATSVDVEVRALMGGRYASGGWLAVEVALANDGAPTEGYVEADTASGTARRFVELPAGARKAVTLYLRPEAFQRSVNVRFEAPEGTATASTEVRVLERSTRQVVIVGDGAGNLRPQLLGPNDSGLQEPIGLAPADLPERPEPLHGIAAIVWAADSATLSEPQRRAIERWIGSGGQLIVIGGPDWQARTAAFVDLLPVEAIGGVDDVSLDGLEAFTGAPAPEGIDAGAALGALRDDAVELAPSDQAGLPLLAMATRGAGLVVYSGVDLATALFRTWEGAPLMWARLVPNDAWIEQAVGPGFPIEEEAGNLMAQALSNIPSLEVPPAELLLIVIVGYIVLIGPVSYIVLRRMDRRELAWISAPVLIVLFSACSYGIGSTLKGGEIIVNQISLVRTAAGGSAASVETYAGLFSPSRATYDLTVEADALVAPLRTANFEQPGRVQQTQYVTEQGDPAHLRGLSLGVFGFQALRADAITSHQPNLEVAWRIGDGEITGTVTNLGDAPIEDVAVISGSGGEMVGDLEPGESRDFEMSLSNFNGSSASDQVYGFGGFDASGESQRQTLSRRSVIDSLVGYGGFFPGRGVVSGGVDRGPFVIGWRSAEGPVPISVDGQSVRRYEQVVEIVSGRPAMGPGEVRLDPGQLGVQIASTDGDASATEPGFATVGNGEVVFAITLPLAATALEATSVDIVIGPDPSMVLSDPGGFGGFFPPGFTASVRDMQGGGWIELGDLSQRGRFEVDDPSSVISPTGRIEVRVVGADIDASFGQTSVFASAEITGVVE